MSNSNFFPPIIDNSITGVVCNFDGKDVMRIYFYFQSKELVAGQYVLLDLQMGGETMFYSNDYEPFYVWADEENLFTDERYYIEVPVALLKDKYTYYSKQSDGTYGNPKKAFPKNSVLRISLMSLGKDLAREGYEDIFYRIQDRVWNRHNFPDLNFTSFANEEAGVQQDKDGNYLYYHSDWSTASFRYPTLAPNIETWGALTQEQIISKTSLNDEDKEEKKLYDSPEPNTTQNYFSVLDKYRFRSQLSYDDEAGPNLYIKQTSSLSDADQKDDQYIPVDNENDVLIYYEAKLYGVKNTEQTVEHEMEDGTQVTLYATDIPLEETAGKNYIDTYWDSTRKSFVHTLKYDFNDSPYESYKLAIAYYTRKGGKIVQIYPIFPSTTAQEDTLENETGTLPIEITNFTVDRDSSKGAITLGGQLSLKNGATSYAEKITGTLIFERAIDTGKNNLTWQVCYQEKRIYDFTETSAIPFVYDDITAEPGIIYKYRVKFRSYDADTQLYQYVDTKYFEAPVILFVEDIFLATKDLTLKVRYDPDVSSYKRNVVDVITPTLGGAYPFVRRNGAQIYRTFNLGGLISFNSELYEPSNDKLVDSLFKYPYDKTENIDNEFKNSLFINTISAKNKIDSTRYKQMVTDGFISREEKRMIYEKIFRDMVMDFLYKDQIVLFKSQSEGNILVQLSNISFTPNKQLDRHIYSFSATATEVLEANNENYQKLFSNVVDDGAEFALNNVYILSGMYEYHDGVLYIGGSTDDDSLFIDTNLDSENYLSAPVIWNEEGVLWNDPEIAASYLVGENITQAYDTWGVAIASEDGAIPAVTWGDKVSEDIVEETTQDLNEETPVTTHEQQIILDT